MLNLNNHIINYVDYCKYQKTLSKKTIKAYMIDLTQFNDYSSTSPAISERDSISQYITHLHKLYQPKTVKRKIASMKAFFNYLEYEEIISDNPIKKIHTKFQEPQVLPKTIPLKVIKMILASAYKSLDYAKTVSQTRTALRDAAIIELLFATGMRVSELCSLGESDINLDDGNVRIMGKGSKERVLQVENLEVRGILKRYRKECNVEIASCGFFFVNRLHSRISEQSVRFMLKKHCTKASVGINITPHMFRHSFASLLLEEDVDIRYIQKMLGHSSIVTTQIYTQVSSQKQREILATKHPRNKFIIRANKKVG